MCVCVCVCACMYTRYEDHPSEEEEEQTEETEDKKTGKKDKWGGEASFLNSSAVLPPGQVVMAGAQFSI